MGKSVLGGLVVESGASQWFEMLALLFQKNKEIILLKLTPRLLHFLAIRNFQLADKHILAYGRHRYRLP